MRVCGVVRNMSLVLRDGSTSQAWRRLCRYGLIAGTRLANVRHLNMTPQLGNFVLPAVQNETMVGASLKGKTAHLMD